MLTPGRGPRLIGSRSLPQLPITHAPLLNLTGNLAENFPPDFQILPSDFRDWEFSTISPNSDGKSEILTEIPPPDSAPD